MICMVEIHESYDFLYVSCDYWVADLERDAVQFNVRQGVSCLVISTASGADYSHPTG